MEVLKLRLPADHPLSHASVLLTVSEAEAAAIRAAFEQRGSLPLPSN
jgi:hypothetical protein